MRNLRPILLSLLVTCAPMAAAAAQITFRGGERMVTLEWRAYDSLSTVRVFRAPDSTSAGADISGPLTRTNYFVDKTLTPGTLYFYSLEVKTPRAGPKPIRLPAQRFTLMKAPVALPKRP